MKQLKNLYDYNSFLKIWEMFQIWLSLFTLYYDNSSAKNNVKKIRKYQCLGNHIYRKNALW